MFFQAHHLTRHVLKFKFYDPRRVKHSWAPLVGDDLSLETIAYYADPFYNECRAYGSIHDAVKRKRLRPDVIIPCHGFMFLSERDLDILENRGVDLRLNQVPREYQKATIGGLRARAIVKNLASGESGINNKTIRKVLRDVLTLNYQGVYNMDIRLDNFRDGKLVDFGSAWTDPHIFLEESTDENANAERIADRLMFNEMVEDHEISLPPGIGPVHDMRLRRRQR